MAPKTEKQPEDNRKIGNLRLLWGYASKYPQQIAAAIFFLILSSAATLAIPYGFKRVIDLLGGGCGLAHTCAARHLEILTRTARSIDDGHRALL